MAPEAHGAQVIPDHVFGPIIQTLNRARNLDLEGPEPHVLLEPWSVIFRQSLLNKRCSTLELTFLATFALTIHLIILI